MIGPSHHRVWVDDLAGLLEARITGKKVYLKNVRNFEWRKETDYTMHRESRTYDLDYLHSADLVPSPHIAHTLISFGFDNGGRIVFSLEIHRKNHDTFSTLRGFFRRFEQVLIAADERDFLSTRSNFWGEDVYLYRLRTSQANLRTLFLEYLHEVDALQHTPRVYNRVTSNCITIFFMLAQLIAPTLPLDYRLLLSGYFAEYIYDLHGLTSGYRYPELQALGYINEPALAADEKNDDFSKTIQRGVPGVFVEGTPP
ncbi:hypothetical protein A8B84_20640 [Marinobacter sp. EhC06]|jgi:hypothetical protein|uniref:Lnb N-terminal periplasmic domain-containing protein n=1 Tax=Marinobacter TaxID=2742 RepID=UPI0007D9B888|nr:MULTISPECIES: DUF4105 domain-containing protein [unclassified Marinobacter]OAN90612.1 hypothetical protein A8B80_20600 [Marinobacter sp. EhN04]OAN92747.1 hypothetical protein A8B84_20640 [Marinobacter sp. EhC06]